MEPLRLKPRQTMEEEIENWDDDEDFVVEGDELSFRSSFTTHTGFLNSHTSSRPPSRRRDSTSSHVSFRSELESVVGEETQLHLPGDDENSTLDAIAAAEHAGIPLPKNIPSSALMGGTIKRLGGRTIKQIVQEDWETDLEIPDASQAFSVKPKNDVEFPETLPQVSEGSIQSSPSRTTEAPVPTRLPPLGLLVQLNTSPDSPSSALKEDNFDDIQDDDGIFGDGSATVKIAKGKGKLSSSPAFSCDTPTPTPQKAEKAQEHYDEDFEQDFELPSDGKLRLSTKKDIPRTPSLSSNLDDLDWGEGSLGTRYGGTRRDGRSARSSSASALSPSMSSSMTAESEDEMFEGLVLPPGPFDLQERLQQRRKNFSPERVSEDASRASSTAVNPALLKKSLQAEADREDFFDDLDVGDGNFFGRGKLTLHRNIKIKQTQTASPARPKTAISLTFTNKPIASSVAPGSGSSSPSTSQTRVSRPSHERAHSTSLEPVYETTGGASGASLWRTSRHPQSRQGHSHQSSVSSLPTPTTTSPGRQFPLSTPRGRELASKSSFSSLKGEASTTNSQLLKQKRSLLTSRTLNSVHSKPMSSHRPPSRGETTTGRPQSGLRPKTPVERHQRLGFNDSPASLTRKAQPFLPAGASQGKSQHVASKTLRQLRRHDSDNSIDFRPHSRGFSRPSTRSPSPHRYRIAADTWERLSKPKNKKHFGNGHELDGFDDLPTSRDSETRYLKQPLASGTAKAAIRNKLYQNILPDRTVTATPAPLTPSSLARTTLTATTATQTTAHTPRFARDTTASRIARETSLAHRAPSHGPLHAMAGQREAQVPLLGPRITGHLSQQHSSAPGLPQTAIRSRKKTKRPPQLKPHLIANLNVGKDSKVVNGMYYNADTFQWEGNENALHAFDATLSTPTSTAANAAAAAASMAAHHYQTRDKDVGTPRPALITNISATKGVQVVSGMVFDPQNMCWLKLGRHSKARSEATTDTMDGFDALDDEDDVFRDIPDLDDNMGEEDRHGEGGGSGRGRVSDVKDDWLVGEEFDVGPEFIRRQREEEDRWRKKCEKWVGRGPRDLDIWRWTIRDLVSQVDDLTM
ncbi:hypothetical protein E4U42_002983 [Claviceps africana]|uniref:Cytokinesis inhibitor byr4 n=1 Tax=Claviceps africana TaxID=83212 RepID=A0A8K0J7T3_9HYPO|nr:hypothetical protein E4U42_002983 [Claviceps africana]